MGKYIFAAVVAYLIWKTRQSATLQGPEETRMIVDAIQRQTDVIEAAQGRY